VAEEGSAAALPIAHSQKSIPAKIAAEGRRDRSTTP